MKPGLRIVASDANQRGDTLTLLSRDLFHTLGYEDCRFNVHKSGRELDVEATHCYENRRLVAECKATSDPIGGSDINKFVGALDAEKRRHKPTPVHGYFVSLSGFRETAIEQEKEFGDNRLTLITGNDIVRRLAESSVVVSADVAIENATRCATKASDDLRIMKVELLGHVGGWAWHVEFGTDFEATHVCLVHADGRVLSKTAASALLDSSSGLKILHAALRAESSDEEPDLDYYKDYLLNEYGAITLEGMPADHEVGSRSFRLERLYVPLQLRLKQGGSRPPADNHIGSVLSVRPRVAVLGSPGAGKTTILKRLAIAYADPARKLGLNDSLPDDDWLPVFIKCRHVAGGSGHKPITEIIGDLMTRAECPDKRQEFVEAVSRKLREGKVLLLIDGLDEISDTGERVSFVSQLRTFLARYPSIRVVVTSREVGFRAVGGAVAAICEPCTVRELSEDDIRQLVQAWHREVLGDRSDVHRDAAELADSIVMSDRVMRLAVNPLLLTTLLLVKRWVGQLPRKRTVLYQKAVEVLLMTWNVEGHEPINQEEALPQLAYAAFSMMEAGKTQVSANELTSLFEDARSAIPEIFAYARTSVNDFIQRVEERSSLLVLSGHQVIDGSLQPIYEFKHLTFQEYLAALAITNGWVLENKRDDPPELMLQPHLGDESWREVVALTSVMAGRRAAGLIELLITMLRDPDVPPAVLAPIQENLIDCLYDEVAVAPRLAQAALEAIIERDKEDREGFAPPLRKLLKTRLAELLRETLNDAILSNKKPLGVYCHVFVDVATADLRTEADSAGDLCARIVAGLNSDSVLEQCAAAGGLMNAAFMLNDHETDGGPFAFHELAQLGITWEHLVTSARAAAQRLTTGLPQAAGLLFTWAVAWCARIIEKDAQLSAAVMTRTLGDWLDDDDHDVSHFSGWLVGELVDTWGWHEQVNREEIFPKLNARWQDLHQPNWQGLDIENQRMAVLAVAVRLGGPWPRSMMIEMLEPGMVQRVAYSKRCTTLLELIESR